MSEEKPKKICIIACQGSLDMAYPPLILATTAVAMDMEAVIFFTFYGLEIIKKKPNLQVSPIGNAAAPPPIPSVPIGVPNIVGMLPGMTGVATAMMKNWMKNANVAPLEKLLDTCIKNKVLLIGCQMTMDVMSVKREDLIDGITLGGAAMYLDHAVDADVNLFV